HRLVDENGSISRLELLDSTTTTTGIVIATYGTSRD
ncbi:MAG: hypothetical protein QOE98_1424, partial [Gaiellaceae bacterium]|nr:hypothetical protein [Gaiellaceae bacterium]